MMKWRISRQLMAILAIIILVFVLSVVGVFNRFNGPIYDYYQQNAIKTNTNFDFITVKITKPIGREGAWNSLLSSLFEWKAHEVFVINNGVESVNLQLKDQSSVFIVEPFKVDDSGMLISERTLFSNSYVANYPNFSSGIVRNYLPLEKDDITEHFIDRVKEPIFINYMFGAGYLPSTSFEDVINQKVDPRMFHHKKVIIITDYNNAFPTPMSLQKGTDEVAYYGFLFETMSQQNQLDKLRNPLNLLMLTFVAFFVYWTAVYLPKNIKLLMLALLLVLVFLISYMQLVLYQLMLPVIEMILIVISVFLVHEKNKSFRQEREMILVNRVYTQILESNKTLYENDSNLSLLSEFSRFLLQLTGLTQINYVFKTNTSKSILEFDGVDLKINEQSDSKQINCGHCLNIKLSNDEDCILAFSQDADEFQHKKIDLLISKNKPYLRPLLSRIFSEIRSQSDSFLGVVLKGQDKELFHEKFKRVTDNFINHYMLLSNHFNSSKVASILYGINGNLVRTNPTAVELVKTNTLRTYNQTLIESLLEITGLDMKDIQEGVFNLIDDHELVIVWPTHDKIFKKNHIVILSVYLNENRLFSGFILELVNIDEVNFIAELKQRVEAERYSQLRNDFAEVLLELDMIDMGVDVAPTIGDVSDKVEAVSAKLNSSKLMVKTVNEIMSHKVFAVDIRRLIKTSVQGVENIADEKAIKIAIEQPNFVNLVLVNYQEFVKNCKNMLKLAIQDSLEESELTLSIKEVELNQQRTMLVTTKTNGYGLFDENITGPDDKHSMKVETLLANMGSQLDAYGGQVSLNSKIGVGTTIKILIPCYQP